MLVFVIVFFAVCGLVFVIYVRSPRDERQVVSRLRQLASEDKRSAGAKPRQATLAFALPRLGRLLMPQRKDRLGDLKNQLVQAGFYNPTALRHFLGAKLILMVVLPVCALMPHSLGMLSRHNLLLAALVASCMGILIPNFWLTHQVKLRHRLLRSA